MKPFLTLFLCFAVISCFAQNPTYKSSSHQTVNRIFKEYIKYQESVDSYENKEAMRNSFKSLERNYYHKSLPLLIDVWMYYDPTDFPTRDLIQPIFYKNIPEALKAVDQRLENRKKWEDSDTAPYADLVELKKELSAKKGLGN